MEDNQPDFLHQIDHIYSISEALSNPNDSPANDSVQQIDHTYSIISESLSNPNDSPANNNNAHDAQHQQIPQKSLASLSTRPLLTPRQHHDIPVKPRRPRLNSSVQSTKVKAPDTVIVYDRDRNPVSIKERKKEGSNHRGEKFAAVLRERTDARRNYTISLISKIIQYKNRTSDDTLIVLHDKDREEKYSYTTNLETLAYDSNQQISAIPSPNSLHGSPLPPVPSFAALAQSSPSKRMRIDKETLVVDKDSCRICKIKWKSRADVECDSPWMGCNRKDCGYWVHSVCKGFADATEEEIDELNLYCPDHNTRAKNMLKLKGRKQQVGNSQTKENDPPTAKGNKKVQQKSSESGTKKNETYPVKTIETKGPVRGTGVKTRGGVRGTGVKTRGGVRGTGVKTRGGVQGTGVKTRGGVQGTGVKTRGGVRGTGVKTRGGVRGTGVKTRGGVRGTGVKTRGGCATRGGLAQTGQIGEEPTTDNLAIPKRGGTR